MITLRNEIVAHAESQHFPVTPAPVSEGGSPAAQTAYRSLLLYPNLNLHALLVNVRELRVWLIAESVWHRYAEDWAPADGQPDAM